MSQDHAYVSNNTKSHKHNCTTDKCGHYYFVKHGLLTICFSVYLFELSRLTASMWPKSMSWPSRKMNSNLHTYFFFWYPSSVLSPKQTTVFLSISYYYTSIPPQCRPNDFSCYNCRQKNYIIKSNIDNSVVRKT